MTETRAISEGILIATASALSYAVAFAYDTGYAKYFGIPPLFISPNVGAVLKAAGIVGITLLTFWNIANGLWLFIPRGTSARSRAIQRLATITLITGLLIFYLLEGLPAWLTLAIVVGFFGFYEFVFPLIVNRKIVGYENKLLAQEAIEEEAQKHTLLEKTKGIIGEDGLRLLAFSLILLIMATVIGGNTAKNQEDFYVLAGRPNAVILSMHENVLILGNYDPETLMLSGSYVLEQLSDAHQWKLEKRKIGKLKPPPKAISIPVNKS